MSTTLFYFPLRGRGHQIRLALAEAGVPFVEGGGNLPALRADGTALFGSLPILVHDGVKIAQGCNIVSFIGEKFGFGGATADERAEVNQFILAAEDFRGPVVGVYYMKKDKNEFLQGPWARWMSCFESHLQGKEYIALGRFTSADIAIFDVVSQAYDLIPDVPISDYPNVKAHMERIRARPNIAAFFANNNM